MKSIKGLLLVLISLVSCTHQQEENNIETRICWYENKKIVNESFINCINKYISYFNFNNNYYYTIKPLISTSALIVYELNYKKYTTLSNIDTPSGSCLINGHFILLYTGFEPLRVQRKKAAEHPIYLSTRIYYIQVNKKTGTSKLTGNFPNPDEIWEWPKEVEAIIQK